MFNFRCFCQDKIIIATLFCAVLQTSLARGGESESPTSFVLENAIKTFSAPTDIFDPETEKYERAHNGVVEYENKLIDRCLCLLRENKGRKPQEMKPNYIAVREAISLLGLLSGACKRFQREQEVVYGILSYLTEEFNPPPKQDGFPPLGSDNIASYKGDKYIRGTFASRSLILYGSSAVPFIFKWIREGGLGDSYDTAAHKNKEGFYGPYLLDRVLSKLCLGFTANVIEQSIHELQIVSANIQVSPPNSNKNIKGDLLSHYLEYFKKLHGLQESMPEKPADAPKKE